MTVEPRKRALFNELATLLERLNPNAMSSLIERYPEYADEIIRGPDAGEAETSRTYYEDRALFTSSLCNELVPAIYELADKIISRASSLSSSRLVVALLAGIGGAATLGSIGIGKEEIARIAGIFTSGTAILNAGLDSLAKRYTAAETQKAIDLKKAALQLSQLRHDMELAVRHGRDLVEIDSAVEKCNQIALELNQRKDQLRLV
jgi:hypothetical protein